MNKIGLTQLSEKIYEKLAIDNLDDSQTKKDRISYRKSIVSSAQHVSDLCAYISQYWDDSDAWLALAQVYEKKQKFTKYLYKRDLLL